MRIFIPGTRAVLDDLVRHGALAQVPITAFAVTPGLREWYVDDEIEELEYAALTEAARASLRLLALDPAPARRRVVIAADVPEAQVSVRDDLDRGVVRLDAAVPLGQIASIHVDDAEATDVVARAADAMIEADLGDDEAQAAVDDAEGFELSWYANQEIPAVLESMD